MKESMNVPAVNKRLKRVEGQIRGIIRMVDEDKPCEELLIQLSSAKAALQKISQLILQAHLSACLQEASQQEDSNQTLQKIAVAIEQFSRIV